MFLLCFLVFVAHSTGMFSAVILHTGSKLKVLSPSYRRHCRCMPCLLSDRKHPLRFLKRVCITHQGEPKPRAVRFCFAVQFSEDSLLKVIPPTSQCFGFRPLSSDFKNG